MQSVDQILKSKWVVPIDGQQSVHEDYAVVIDQGQILAVDTACDIAASYHCEQVTELPSHMLMPGFVNAHTHAAMTLLRGYADDLPLMEWLSQHIWPAEEKWVDEAFMIVGTDLALVEMIKGGTTCFNDMYFFPNIVAQRSQKAGMRATIGMIIIDFPSAWAQNSDEYLSKGLELRDQIRYSPLISTTLAPHAPYSVSDNTLTKIATLSEGMQCPVHMHVHETAYEIKDSVTRFNMRPLERLDQFGLLNPNMIAIHMTQLLPMEIETVAERGIHVIHCPESNLKLASGFCPTVLLNKVGVNVAIGTDGASSNNDLDMLSETRTASLISKGVSANPLAFNAFQSLEAATLSGAKALGLDHLIGSIEVGKQADIIAINLEDASTQPVYHPVSQVVYSAGRNQISDVWVAGKRLLQNGLLTTLDQEEIQKQAQEWGGKIRAG